MRILHVLNTNKFSGAENMVCQIISFFRFEQNVEMIYCSPDGEIREALAERGVSFAPIKEMCVKEIKRVVAEIRPDVIHAHDMKASYIVSKANGRIPFVCHIHNNAYDSRKITPKSIAFLLAAQKAKHIFWVSDSAQNGYVFKWFVKRKSSVLYNIIDVDAVKKKAEDESQPFSFDVIYVGRLSEEKNPLRLINIFEKVVQKDDKLTLGIVGSGLLEDNLNKRIQELGLGRNVSLLGFKNNPLSILNHSKVMAMTSLWEGLPMCALEAQALGIPIVSTPTDGLKTLITNGETGYLTDNDEDFSQMLFTIATNSDIRGKLSQNVIKQSIRFNNIENYRQSLMTNYKN